MPKWISSPVLCVLVLLMGCSSHRLSKRLESFHFVLRYGVHAVNSLDTFRDTLTVAVSRDSLVAIPFALNPEQLARIHAELEAIRIWDYPDTLNPCADQANSSVQSPYETIILTIHDGRRNHRIYWAAVCGRDTPRSRALRRVTNLIRSWIVNDPRYRKIPRIQEGYH